MGTIARIATILLSAALALAASSCKKPASRLTSTQPIPTTATPITSALQTSTHPTTHPTKNLPSESTQRMAARLAKLTEEIDLTDPPWVVNHRRAEMFAARLARPTDWKPQA